MAEVRRPRLLRKFKKPQLSVSALRSYTMNFWTLYPKYYAMVMNLF